MTESDEMKRLLDDVEEMSQELNPPEKPVTTPIHPYDFGGMVY